MKDILEFSRDLRRAQKESGGFWWVKALYPDVQVDARRKSEELFLDNTGKKNTLTS